MGLPIICHSTLGRIGNSNFFLGSTRNYFFCSGRIERGTFFVYLTIGHVISCVFPYCLVEKEHVQWLSVFVCLLVNKIEKLGSPFYAWFPTFSSRIFTILLFFFYLVAEQKNWSFTYLAILQVSFWQINNSDKYLL